MLERLGRALWVNAETEAALEAHEAAVRIMPVEPPTAELARVLSGYGQILMLLDRWSESTVLCKRAVDIARDVGARQVEGHALNTYGLDLAVGGRCEEGFAELEASLAIAREVANADDIGRAYNNLGEARRVCGDVRGALEVTRAGVAAAEEIGLSRTYGTFIGANGVSYGFDLGLWEEADRTAEAYVATHQMSRPQRRYGLTRWLPLLVAEGDDRVDASLDELRMLLEGVPVEAQFHSPYRLSIAESALWRGEPDKALASIRQGLDEIRQSEWPRYHLRLYRVGMRAVADMAEVERARRNPDGERQAVEAGTDLWGSLQLIPGIADGDARRDRERDGSRGRDGRGRTGTPGAASGSRASGGRPPIGGGLARTRTSWPIAGGARPRRCSATATGPGPAIAAARGARHRRRGSVRRHCASRSRRWPPGHASTWPRRARAIRRPRRSSRTATRSG